MNPNVTPLKAPMDLPEEPTADMTRAEKKVLHEKNAQERANAARTLKMQYQQLQGHPAIADLVQKIGTFMKYHSEVAKDGVAYEQENIKGEVVQRTVRLDDKARITHLDKAAGQEEIEAYLLRQLDLQKP